MDRNTVVGLLLIGVVLIGYTWLSKPSKEELDDRQRRDDSLALVQQQMDTPRVRETPINQNMITEAKGTDTVSLDELSAQYGDFASAVEGEQAFYVLENNKIKVRISNRGGRIYSVELKEYKRYDSTPLILFDGDSTLFGLNFFMKGNRPVQTNDLYFIPKQTEKKKIAKDSEQSMAFRLSAGNDEYIEYSYSLAPNEYIVNFSMKFSNMNKQIMENRSFLNLNWEMYLPQQELGEKNELTYTSIKYKYFEDEVDGFSDRSTKDMEEEDVPNRLEWIAFKDQFFSSVFMTDRFFEGAYIKQETLPEDKEHLKKFIAQISIPYENVADYQFNGRFYFVPNHFQTLKKYGHELEELVILGKSVIRWINQYVIVPLFNWLDNYIGNYGLIILLLTIIIKMALFPLTYRSYISQAKMKALKPQIDEIGKKFPKKEDAMKKQQATMAFYKKAGVSPMGGCIPMLLQFPILFAMFKFFPTSIELRQESFLWAKDLSTYDSILNLPFNIPLYGDHVSLFTILMTVSTILTMRIQGAGATDTQMPGMKNMMYIMPVMFMFILNSFSAGLTYYYFLSNIITFGQNMLAKQFVDEKALLRKLEANKKKPVKKSKWQERLEAAAKQKGYKPKK